MILRDLFMEARLSELTAVSFQASVAVVRPIHLRSIVAKAIGAIYLV
jgi:hypothetical protein